MLDWDDVRYFLAVRRTGTLAGAGAALRLDPTTVGRRLAVLEESLGARLFERTTTGYVPTDAAERLLPKAEAMEREALALERALAGDDRRLAGVVRLTATEMLATRFIAPYLGRFRERYPDIELELLCSSEALDLGRREADVALRLARPREPYLVVKRLSEVELGLYASRAYLEGAPPEVDVLDGHQVVFFADSRAFARENAWLGARLGTGRIVLRSNSVSTVYSAAVGGLGVALLPCLVADREPELVRLGDATGLEPREVWQMVHRDLAQSARIRAALDFLSEILAPPSKRRRRSARGVDARRPT